jgi:hypothetical protein
MSNEIQAIEQEQQLATVQDTKASSMALMTNDDNMKRAMDMAKVMSGSKVTVPKHLQGNEGDCLAIVFQAMNWGMNPFAVAQKTHLVNGTLGYEAQLVNAVIQESNAIVGRFRYEYQGDGNSLQCRVGAVLRGESEITWNEWLKSSEVTTKNSPLWKTNPKQQLGYLQLKNWSRSYCPGAILGVYTKEELEEAPAMKDLNAPPRRQTGTQAAEQAKQQQAAQFDSAERATLVSNLEKIATDYGTDAYAETWSKMTKQERHMVGADEHARLKVVAASIAGDSSETIDQETGEVTQ